MYPGIQMMFFITKAEGDVEAQSSEVQLHEYGEVVSTPFDHIDEARLTESYKELVPEWINLMFEWNSNIPHVAQQGAIARREG